MNKSDLLVSAGIFSSTLSLNAQNWVIVNSSLADTLSNGKNIVDSQTEKREDIYFPEDTEMLKRYILDSTRQDSTVRRVEIQLKEALDTIRGYQIAATSHIRFEEEEPGVTGKFPLGE